MKRDRELKIKNAQIAKLDEETHEVDKNIGDMTHRPRYDSDYSASKLDKWQRELEKLNEQRLQLDGEIAELKRDPQRIEEIDAV